MFEHLRQQAQVNESEADFQENIMDQCFTIDLGSGETELVPGGAAIPVTK